MSIREATADDAGFLAEMRLALEAEGGSRTPHDPGFRRSVAEWFAARVGDQSFRAWIAEEDGERVAVGGLVFISRPPYTGNPTGIEGLVTSMFTIPDRRGRGIGAMLLDRMIAAAREAGAGRLVLYSSAGAESLYRRHGFTDDVERGVSMQRWLHQQGSRSAGS